jgi:hypothetical protein
MKGRWFGRMDSVYLKKGQPFRYNFSNFGIFVMKVEKKQMPREQILMDDPHGGTVSLTQAISHFG